MDLLKVHAANSVRFLAVIDETKPERSLLPIVKALEERYLFLQVPRTIAEYNLESGVTFLSGVFRGRNTIDKFQVYARGIICETREETDISDEFLDDVLNWAEADLKLEVPDRASMARAYFSQIEIRFSTSLSNSLNMFSGVGQSISNMVQSYRASVVPPLEASSIKLYMDTSAMTGPAPFEFLFERRANTSYSENIYFSAAPLRTKDHLQILQELENVLSNAKR
jgi:hypothetical protein